MTTQTILQRYFDEIQRVVGALSLEQIEAASDILFRAWKGRKAIFAMGNGGSASTATHFACDLAKFTIAPGQPRFKVMGLNDNIPLVSAWTNDNGFGTIFAEQLEPWIGEDDVLVGFSVHGGSGAGEAGPWSQNMVQAMALAKRRGAKIIGFSGFGGGAMKEMADVCVVVPIDTEPYGTPLIESIHVALHHVLCLALKERVRAEGDA